MKKINYKYIVNLVDVESRADLYARFADAKQAAGLPLTDTEYDAVIERTIELCPPTIVYTTTIDWSKCENCVAKKKPWYKRLWNKVFK